MSDGLNDLMASIQLNPLVKELINKHNPQKDCQLCIDLVDQCLKKKQDKRMVFYVCMELLQNISHHAQRLADKDYVGEFFFNNDQQNWYILTKNAINHVKAAQLKTKLKKLNEIADDQEALKQLYKEVISSESPISKHAGLGLIDIVRKSKHPLTYHFNSPSKDYIEFTVCATISKK